MMALRATAEGGDRFAVVIDKVSGVKHAPPCERWIAPSTCRFSIVAKTAIVEKLFFRTQPLRFYNHYSGDHL
jgi:hypothetical protein